MFTYSNFHFESYVTMSIYRELSKKTKSIEQKKKKHRLFTIEECIFDTMALDT